MNLGPRARDNEFVKSWLENWNLMSLTTSKVDLDDKKMKIDLFDLKKIIIGTI